MKHSMAPIVSLVVIVASCGGTAGDAGFTVRDSAGVELVEMSGAFAANAPELTLHQDLRIGALDGPPEFEFGGEGEGPGKFTGPWYLSLVGDTIVTVDRLIQAFDRDGKLIDAVGPRLVGRNPNVWELDVTDAGWLVKTRSTFSNDMRRAGVGTNRDATGPFADTTYIEQFDPESGARRTTIFVYPLETWYRLHGAFHVVPFLEPTPYHKVSGDGRIHFTRGSRYEIETWAPLNTLERPGMMLARRITADVPSLPRTKELVDMHLAVQRELFENMPTGGEIDIWREIQLEDVLELPGPEHRPVIGRLFVAPGGEIVVERLDLDEEPFRDDNPTTWDLIGVDGFIEGRFTLSDRFRPMTLTPGGLLGVLRDDLDVQYVVRYRIEQAN